MSGKNIVLYPPLLALYPVLFLYSHNIDEVVLAETIMPALIAVSGAGVLFAAGRLWLKDATRAGLLASLGVVLFFSFGHVFTFFHRLMGEDRAGRDLEILLALWVLLFAAGIGWIVRTRRNLAGVNIWLNTAALVLVGMALVNPFIRALTSLPSASGPQAATFTAVAGERPDIYYIILDGYGRADALREVYGFDNSQFEEDLRRRGFIITPESCSNYATTFLSLASSLNMEHVILLADRVGRETADRTIPYDMIRNSRVARFLKGAGYTVVTLASGWGPTNGAVVADVKLHPSQWSEFEVVLMQSTVLRVFERRLLKKNARDRILSTFEKIQEAPDLDRPLFVFAHLLLPHPPYLFDRNGNPPPDLPFKLRDEVWQNKAAHVEQTLFTNVKVLAMVDKLLSAPGPAPIIILQGDHGTAASATFKAPTEELIRERMRIFSAFYFPEHRRPEPPVDISSVNTFRFIFTHFFAADLPMLEDKLYFSTYERPYAFEDVTSLVHRPAGSPSPPP